MLQFSSDVGLVFVCWVCGDGFDVVLGKEGSYFLVVFILVSDDRCFFFVGRVIIALLCMFFCDVFYMFSSDHRPGC